jgi:excisionase family DNA binding protein
MGYLAARRIDDMATNIYKSPSPLAPLSYSHRDAAKVLGVSESTLWRWKRDGKVPFKQIGRVVLYPRAGLVAFLADSSPMDNQPG